MSSESKRFRVLSLDGEGIKGAFTAAVLAEWEQRTGRIIACRYHTFRFVSLPVNSRRLISWIASVTAKPSCNCLSCAGVAWCKLSISHASAGMTLLTTKTAQGIGPSAVSLEAAFSNHSNEVFSENTASGVAGRKKEDPVLRFRTHGLFSLFPVKGATSLIPR